MAPLVRIVKEWDYPDLLRQTPGGKGEWNGVRFTLEKIEACDFLIILNKLNEDITVFCPPENVWAVFQEPYVLGFSPWMREGHRDFHRVYTHHPPMASKRYHPAPPLLPWHVDWTFDELRQLDVPEKTDEIAWVTSNLQGLPGHRRRFAFYRYLSSLGWGDLKVFGRGINPIDDKREALAGSRYGIAVENSVGDHYWTEKIFDCWLSFSLPIYFGCPNLESYFPGRSFVRIDLDDFATAARTIRQVVDNGEYEKRLPAIREARELLLYRYQFFPYMAHEIARSHSASAPRMIHLRQYRQSRYSLFLGWFYKRMQLLNAIALSQYI